MFYLQRGSYVEAVRLNEELKQDTMVRFLYMSSNIEAVMAPFLRVSEGAVIKYSVIECEVIKYSVIEGEEIKY